MKIDAKKVNRLHEKYSTRAMDLMFNTENERSDVEQAQLDLLNEIIIDLVSCGCEN